MRLCSPARVRIAMAWTCAPRALPTYTCTCLMLQTHIRERLRTCACVRVPACLRALQVVKGGTWGAICASDIAPTPDRAMRSALVVCRQMGNTYGATVRNASLIFGALAPAVQASSPSQKGGGSATAVVAFHIWPEPGSINNDDAAGGSSSRGGLACLGNERSLLECTRIAATAGEGSTAAAGGTSAAAACSALNAWGERAWHVSRCIYRIHHATVQA